MEEETWAVLSVAMFFTRTVELVIPTGAASLSACHYKRQGLCENGLSSVPLVKREACEGSGSLGVPLSWP